MNWNANANFSVPNKPSYSIKFKGTTHKIAKNFGKNEEKPSPEING